LDKTIRVQAVRSDPYFMDSFKDGELMDFVKQVNEHGFLCVCEMIKGKIAMRIVHFMNPDLPRFS